MCFAQEISSRCPGLSTPRRPPQTSPRSSTTKRGSECRERRGLRSKRRLLVGLLHGRGGRDPNRTGSCCRTSRQPLPCAIARPSAEPVIRVVGGSWFSPSRRRPRPRRRRDKGKCLCVQEVSLRRGARQPPDRRDSSREEARAPGAFPPAGGIPTTTTARGPFRGHRHGAREAVVPSAGGVPPVARRAASHEALSDVLRRWRGGARHIT